MIGEKVITTMGELSLELLKSESLRISKAYAKQDDGKLTVSISYTLQPSQSKGMIDVDATVSYTMEKVKEKITARVAENQAELPLK